MSGSALKARALIREADEFISDLWRVEISGEPRRFYVKTIAHLGGVVYNIGGSLCLIMSLFCALVILVEI